MRRTFRYTALQQSVWDAEILSLVAQICEHKGRQEFYLKDQTVAQERLVASPKLHSVESSNRIEGISTSNARIQQIVGGCGYPSHWR